MSIRRHRVYVNLPEWQKQALKYRAERRGIPVAEEIRGILSIGLSAVGIEPTKNADNRKDTENAA
jgi:plasmid stability protein